MDTVKPERRRAVGVTQSLATDPLQWPRDEPVQRSWPDLTCYGCGPANDEGLHLHSYLAPDGDALVATVDPDPTHNAGAPNVMYGGHVASLVDCHAIWTAITFAYADEGRPLDSDPQIGYVTANLDVTFRAPTPLDEPVELRAEVVGDVGEKTRVSVDLGPEGETTATAEVLAVRRDPGDLRRHRDDSA